MIHPKMNEIIEDQKNRYKVVIAVAKRAREIVDDNERDMTPLVRKSVEIAIEEFEDGTVRIV